ncbi:MAG: hypothetical protein LBJ63_00440 [Prevotellaceae bacterium]|jgi:hypothetical protein|nr:hypothetical protein [Prevotellaceae bacterium]
MKVKFDIRQFNEAQDSAEIKIGDEIPEGDSNSNLILSIIEKLIEKSKAKKVLWEKTSGDGFMARLKNSSIVIDNYGVMFRYYEFRLFDKDGNTLYYIKVNNDNNEDSFNLLCELSNAAKCAYYKTDEILTDILKELNK